MATSRKQQLANKANAKKSTGPKTRAGKTRSKMNAMKHGILSSETLIADGETVENAEALADLRDELRADLAPVGTLEEFLVDRLLVQIWRLRRLLRFETGATREVADDVVASWVAQQREAQRIRDQIDAQLRRMLPDSPPKPPKWIETDDLESDLKLAEDDSEALKLENPLEQPCPDLGWALLHAADEQGVDARTHVGLDASADLAEVIESGEFTRNQLERLFGALRHPWESESGCWHRLRSVAEWKRDRAASEIAHRRRQEDRLRMMAAIPRGSAIEKVIRYEAHLSREFDRTLRQLSERQARRA